MFHYKAKFTMLILLLLLLQPIPTPTPTLADSEVTKIANDVTNSVLSLVVQGGVLAVVALAFLFGIFWVVFVGRKRVSEGSSFNSLIIQMGKTNELLETVIDKYFVQENERAAKQQEGIEAIAIGNKEIRELMLQSRDSDRQHNVLFERQTTLFETLINKGSTPLQQLAARVEKIDTQGTAPLKRLQESVNQVIEMIGKQDVHNVSLLTEIRDKLDKALETKIVEVEKRSTDSKPIPAIPDNQQVAS